MAGELLEIKNLSVGIESGEILSGVDLTIRKGETHVLMGPNGAGKSTLGSTIMGNPVYEVKGGRILFDGEDVTRMTPDKRARAGLFMSFQNPLEVPGITLENFIRNAVRQRSGRPVKLLQFKKQLEQMMKLLQMDESYAGRELNVGFSGGEKKKAEILQLLMLKPSLAILDETDSGLDVDAVRTVSRGIEEYRKNSDGALLIITHNAKILEALDVDYTHILVQGHVAATGGPELITQISRRGFEEYLREVS